MRLPKDRGDWTGAHAEKAYAIAWKLFEEYEAKVDFDHRERTDELYSLYLHARDEAIDIATATSWDEAKARALP